MTEFEKWLADIEKEYPRYQDKDGYNIGNTRALKTGWKASKRHYLNWILNIIKGGDALAYFDNDILMAIENNIKRELSEKT